MRFTRRGFVGLAAGAACVPDTWVAREPDPPVIEPQRDAAPSWRAALGALCDLAPAHAAWLADAGEHHPPTERARAIMRRHGESDRTVADHLAGAPNPPVSPRTTLVLRPLGSFPLDVVEGAELVGLVCTPPLSALAEVLGAIFGVPTRVLTPQPFDAAALPWRERQGFAQLDAQAFLADAADALPDDAYAMLTLVNRDLFAAPEQNYAFGWSMHRGRLGVASFVRLDPSFHGGRRPDDLDAAMWRRGVRLLGHECAHLFGLHHCSAFACLLGPVDVLDDLDALPVHLCPVCQCKLLRSAGVDPIETVRDGVAVFERLGLEDEAAWARRRLATVA